MASPFEQGDLWGALGSDDDDGTQKKEISVFTGNKLAELSPSEMEIYDRQIRIMIYNETDELKKSLGFCDRITIAAYKVADYVPDLSNNKYSPFWKEQVIPNLVQNLTQHIRARSIIVRSLSSIRDLSITIQKTGEIVRRTKGSPKAIEIAQKDIPDALNALEQCIELASTMENSAIGTFADQITKIFEIIGPEAAKFVDQKADIESQLTKHYDDQRKLYTELGDKQGEVYRINLLISAAQKQLCGATQALEETKRRTDALNKLNAEVEQTIKSIAVSIPETVTTTTHKRHGIWLWRRSESSTTKNTVMVQNPNREAEKNYYESIVLSRMKRVQANENDEAAKQRVIKDLNVSLGELTSNYEKAIAELQDCKRTLPEKMKVLQDQIDILHKKIQEIDKTEINTSNMVGHQGNTLIQCLIAVRAFSKTIEHQDSAYAPLVSILNGIKSMVKSGVALLSSSKPEEIFLAGNLLLENVVFLSSYSGDARQFLQASNQYNSLANAIEFKTKKGH